MARLLAIQRVLENRTSASLRHKEQELTQEYKTILKEQQLYWHQQVRKKWLKEGEQNIKFLHTLVVAKRAKKKDLIADEHS